MNLTRSVAALAAALVLPIAAATPAHATPEDGKGCAGTPALPQAYVCVISATPQNALPTTTTTNLAVPVPRVCYVADCVGPTTVNVPVPGVQLGTGAVAVLWYQGVYYPIAVGVGPTLTLLAPYVSLLTGVAGTAVGIALDAVNDAGPTADAWVTFASNTAQPWIDLANDLANDPPTTNEIRDYVIYNVIGYDTYAAIRELVRDLTTWDPVPLACAVAGYVWYTTTGGFVQCNS